MPETIQINQKLNTPVALEISDSKSGLKGWLAIDSIIDNCCCGGVRLSPYVSKQEVVDLAKGMTLKFGFLGMPHGGAKAGIICDEDVSREQKLKFLTSFIASVEERIRPYVYDPYPDMNTNRDDIFDMCTMAGIPVKKRNLIPERGGWYTGLTTIAAARIGARCLGFDFSNATVAIEGFGKVGSAVASDLYKAGNKVVAISTSRGALYSPKGLSVPQLLTLHKQVGSRVVECFTEAEKIEKEKICELDVDIFLPCALGHTVTIDNAPRIRAKLVSPGANFPLTDEAEEELWRRGVLCIPHFISNSGGVLGGTMEFAGFDRTAIIDFVDTVFTKQVELIIEQSRTSSVVPAQFAEKLAMDRFDRVKIVAERKNQMNKIFAFGLNVYRSGIIPKVLCRALARRYFQERIEGNI